jgi:hypothetical protein
MAAASGNGPLVTHMRPCTPRRCVEWMGDNPPSKRIYFLSAVEGVYGPQNTLMLWRFIISGTKVRFEGHTHPQPPQKIHPQARGVVIHPFKASVRSARPHVGR